MKLQNMVGKKNIYICKDRHVTVTVDKDPGVTPWVIKCPEEGCSADAKSQMYPVGFDGPATHEWYRPTDAEIDTMVAKDYPTDSEAAVMCRASRDEGSLFLRKILVPGIDTLDGTGLGNRRKIAIQGRRLHKNYGNTGTHKTAKPGTSSTNTDARRRLAGRRSGKLSAMKDMAQDIVKPVPKQGRNEICACGSGLKHKRCCGKN